MGGIDRILNAGFLDAVGLPLWLLFLGAFVFVFVRSWVYYYCGWLVASGAQRTRFAAVVESERFEKAAAALDRYGVVAVALSFLILGTGTAITVGAGFMAMNKIRFLIGIIPGGAAWAIIRTTVGLVALDVLVRVLTWNPLLLGIIVVALAVAGVGYAVVRRRRRPDTPDRAPRDQ